MNGGGSFACVDAPIAGRDLVPESTDENVVLGMFCPLSVANPDCANISCNTGSDCSGFPATGDCNNAVGRCLEKDAYCPALPISTGSHSPGWPATQDCNSALGVCIYH